MFMLSIYLRLSMACCPCHKVWCWQNIRPQETRQPQRNMTQYAVWDHSGPLQCAQGLFSFPGSPQPLKLGIPGGPAHMLTFITTCGCQASAKLPFWVLNGGFICIQKGDSSPHGVAKSRTGLSWTEVKMAACHSVELAYRRSQRLELRGLEASVCRGNSGCVPVCLLYFLRTIK